MSMLSSSYPSDPSIDRADSEAESNSAAIAGSDSTSARLPVNRLISAIGSPYDEVDACGWLAGGVAGLPYTASRADLTGGLLAGAVGVSAGTGDVPAPVAGAGAGFTGVPAGFFCSVGGGGAGASSCSCDFRILSLSSWSFLICSSACLIEAGSLSLSFAIYHSRIRLSLVSSCCFPVHLFSFAFSLASLAGSACFGGGVPPRIVTPPRSLMVKSSPGMASFRASLTRFSRTF